MPIKLNGITIIDESTLANTDLSNLTSAGQNTISSIASSTISSGNFMKKINTTTCTAVTMSSEGAIGVSQTTAPFDGWMVVADGFIYGYSNNRILLSYGSSVSASMPIKAGTVIATRSSSGCTVLFFPEVS